MHTSNHRIIIPHPEPPSRTSTPRPPADSQPTHKPADRDACPRRVSPRRLAAACGLWVAGCTAAAVAVPGIAEAASGLAAKDLNEVIANLRDVLVGLLVGLATLFATIGGIRYMLAGGEPAEVESAKKTLKYAAIGYGVAVLAPVLVKLLQHIVGEAQ